MAPSLHWWRRPPLALQKGAGKTPPSPLRHAPPPLRVHACRLPPRIARQMFMNSARACTNASVAPRSAQPHEMRARNELSSQH
eukprot:470458-Alexandrium_andersonii.AAC.1